MHQERRLSQASHQLIVLGTLYLAGLTLSGLFVNVYIWRVDHSYIAIGLFNLALYGALPCAFAAAGVAAQRTGELWMMRVGVVLLACFFLTMLVLGRGSSGYVLPLGMLYGVGQGMYWYGYHVVSFDVTCPATRSWFNGQAGVYGTLAGTIAPFVSGFLLADSRRLSGYHWVFAISLACFVVFVVLSFRLRTVRKPRRLQWAAGWRLRDDPDWRRIVLASAVFGLREGVFTFLIGLLVYFATKSEASLGEYGLYTGLVGLAAFHFAGRLAQHRIVRHHGMLAASVLLGLAGVLFAFHIGRLTLLLYGFITACALPFVLVPMAATTMNEIDESRFSSCHRVEHLIGRETALGVGRVAGTGLFVLVALTRGPTDVIGLAVGLGFAHVGVALLLRPVRYTQRSGNVSIDATGIRHQADKTRRSVRITR
jgi:YQGE family putative transporter